MAINPATITAALGALKGLFGGSATPQAQTLYTPEMLDRLIGYTQGLGTDLNSLYAAPSIGPGGVQSTQAYEMSPREVKAQEYQRYLIAKGFTPDNAAKRINQMQAKGIKYFDDKAFRQWINQGNAPGLKVDRAGQSIKAAPKTVGGQLSVSPQSEVLQAGIQNLAGQSLQALSGLPFLFGQDTARSLQQKGLLSNAVTGLLAGGFNQEGLTQQSQADLDALKNKYLKDFGDLYKDTMQRTTGELIDSGFSSSSLADDVLRRGAYDQQSRFLTDALAALAGKESDLRTQAVARQSQNVSNLLNAFNTLGANQGLGGLTSGILSPAQAGLFTDPQSLGLAMSNQQQNIGNQLNFGQLMQKALSQPISVMPQAPSTLSTIAGIASPILGAAIPRIGSLFGQTLGNIREGIGQFDSRVATLFDGQKGNTLFNQATA